VDPQARKSRESLINERISSSVKKETIREDLEAILETISLKNVSLEERRKEAQKPLFLTRYE